jgi:hypothetical protein
MGFPIVSVAFLSVVFSLEIICGGYDRSADGESPLRSRARRWRLARIRWREAVGTEATSAWTGEKRPKIQSTPTPSGDLGEVARDDAGRSSGEIVHGQDQEQIEGIDWDGEKLSKEIDGLRQWMEVSSYDEDYASAHDDELWVQYNEEQQTALNQRLALCRIRAHEVTFSYNQSI